MMDEETDRVTIQAVVIPTKDTNQYQIFGPVARSIPYIKKAQTTTGESAKGNGRRKTFQNDTGET